MQPSRRVLPALSVALFAGGVRALQLNVPELLFALGYETRMLGAVLGVLSVVTLAANPVGIVATGHYWGTRSAVAREWLQFSGLLFGAAVGGFVVTYVLLAAGAAVAGVEGPDLVGAQVVFDLVAALGLVHVALAGLAGAAVARFRTTESRNSSTATV